MTSDEAKVVRIHALRQQADRELEQARCDQEGALKLALKLEEELAA